MNENIRDGGVPADYDWLDDIYDDVVLAHPLKVKEIADEKIETDEIDTTVLAHLLRADLVAEAWGTRHDPTRAICPRGYGPHRGHRTRSFWPKHRHCRTSRCGTGRRPSELLKSRTDHIAP